MLWVWILVAIIATLVLERVDLIISTIKREYHIRFSGYRRTKYGFPLLGFYTHYLGHKKDKRR